MLILELSKVIPKMKINHNFKYYQEISSYIIKIVHKIKSDVLTIKLRRNEVRIPRKIVLAMRKDLGKDLASKVLANRLMNNDLLKK